MFSFLKPKIKPYSTGYLPEKDGHCIYFQQFGNKNGEVILSFHGGPGGRGKASHAGLFNLKKYRIILFDQRACGLSLFKDPFFKNTTKETMSDAIRLLDYLDIKGKIIINGSSFGSTCALLFAETFPERVKLLNISSVFLGRKQDFDSFSSSSSLFYPDILDLFQKQAGKKDIIEYYHELAFSDNVKIQQKALRYFGSFEKQLGQKDITFPDIKIDDKKLLRLRIMLHYMKNKMFLSDNQIIKNAKKIRNIPTFIYQNRLDFCCPPYQAFEVHKALPKSKLTLFADAGHGSKGLFDIVKKDWK